MRYINMFLGVIIPYFVQQLNNKKHKKKIIGL